MKRLIEGMVKKRKFTEPSVKFVIEKEKMNGMPDQKV
jgi:hypothetical protein